jgi:replication-associated recombination protein RarA
MNNSLSAYVFYQEVEKFEHVQQEHMTTIEKGKITRLGPSTLA